LGLTGTTAYFGVTDVARPQAGETFLISGAAGGIGTVAGQIAKIFGARVFGLAGGEAKCRILVEELGFEGALDYRSPTLAADLEELIPGGPDIYFDNVGGAVSQTVMWGMRRGTRVIECGQISSYGNDNQYRVDIIPIHMNGLRFEGFATPHFFELMPAAEAQLAHWVTVGKIIPKETNYDGLDSLPRAIAGQHRGENVGKVVVTVAEPD
jgi:NADPH-dependent curcumin reductase CurA